VLNRLKRLARGLATLGELPRLVQQADYLQREVERLRAQNRRLSWHQQTREMANARQTKASFEFQWEHMPTGRLLPSDDAFMQQVAEELPAMVGRPAEWFRGRAVVDIGCGIGRYTYGLLQLGAHVTACDQSAAALRRTAELCRAHADRLTLRQVDLLEWNEPAAFDLAFSFGVVHHTGNTYAAVENVARKVRPGGRLFLMIYNVPREYGAYHDVNMYERVAEENVALSFEERKQDMVRRFGEDYAHGWFDATSPAINDRLTLEEIRALLHELGFVGISGRLVARDHYVVADRAPVEAQTP
jgi:SAM-dependent methyltransferase